MGKQSVSPAIIIVAVVVLALVVAGLWKLQTSRSAPGSAGDVDVPITGPPGRTPPPEQSGGR
jgi:hypothetical protein